MASGRLQVESSSCSGAAEMGLYLRRAPAELNGWQIVAPSLRRHGAPSGISEPVSSWRGRVEDTSPRLKQKAHSPGTWVLSHSRLGLRGAFGQTLDLWSSRGGGTCFSRNIPTFFYPLAGSLLHELPLLRRKLHDRRLNRHQRQLFCKNLCCPGDECNSKSLSCRGKLFFNGTLFA